MRCHLLVLLVALATAGQVLAAPQITSLVLPNFIREMWAAGTSMVTQSLDIVSGGIQKASNITNTIGQTAVNIKQQMANTGVLVAADVLNSTMGTANAMADMGTQLANATRLRPVAQVANLGANVIKMGTSLAHAGGMMALNTAHQIATAKLNLTSAALNRGTGLVNVVTNGTISGVQTGVQMVSNLTDRGIAAADQMLSSSLGLVDSGMQLVLDATSSAAASLNGVGVSAQNTLNQNAGTTSQIGG